MEISRELVKMFQTFRKDQKIFEPFKMEEMPKELKIEETSKSENCEKV